MADNDSELVYTTETPTLTAAEIARRRITQDMLTARQRLRDRIDADDE